MVLKSGDFSTSIKALYDKKIGWSENDGPYDCYGTHLDNCRDNIVDTFLKETDQFNLTLPDSKNNTLADVFCVKFPDVPEGKLQLGRSYFCQNDGSSIDSAFMDTMFNIHSKQKLECKEGKAIVTGAGSFLNAQIGMIFSLLGISFAYFNRFI